LTNLPYRHKFKIIKREPAMIHTNILGGLEPRATIGHFGGSYGRGGYWLLSSLAHDVTGRRFGDPAAAETALSAEGWVVVTRARDGYGAARLTVEHIETAAALAAQRAAADDKWRSATPCYVRYGRLPPGGRSRNHADGTVEAGVSVYHGEMLATGEARPLLASNAEWVGQVNFAALGAALYIVAGREIGHGADGEPLLAGCRIVRRAK
jgi:hypothetical protein